MKKITSVFAASLLLFIFCSDVKAKVWINEFSSGSTSDWVEFYNDATESADLTGYKLKDADSNEKDLTGNITAGGFISFDFSNRLNNSADTVFLYKGSELIDYIPYGGKDQVCAAPANESIGRVPDGKYNVYDRIKIPSRDNSNNLAELDPCPPPAPNPTQSPTQPPTAAPTAAPTTTPTKSPTPVPTKKPTPWPSATPDPNYSDQSDHTADVLGLRDSLAPTDTPKSQSGAGGGGPGFPLIAGIFIVAGLGLMGGAGYLAYKKQKQGSSDTISE